jgi:hypothetical protein
MIRMKYALVSPVVLLLLGVHPAQAQQTPSRSTLQCGWTPEVTRHCRIPLASVQREPRDYLRISGAECVHESDCERVLVLNLFH